MTANHKERLDKALIRAGRIDYQLEFTWATPHQISEMYKNILKETQLKYLKKFLHKCRNLETTTAVLQKFFFDFRKMDCILDYYDELRHLSSDENELDESVRHIYT